MARVRVGLRYRVNVHLPVHADDVLDSYLSPLHRISGSQLRLVPLRTLDEWIESRFVEIEQSIVTLVFKQAYRDTPEYKPSHSHSHIHIDVRYPVRHAKYVRIKISPNNVQIYDIPEEINSFRHDSGRGTGVPIRRINLIPYVFGAHLSSFALPYSLGGSIILHGISNTGSYPQFWECLYLTGFERVPLDIKDYIRLKVAKEALVTIGDMVHGVGVSNYSLSSEGMSQSVSGTGGGMDGGGVFSGTIRAWTKEIEMRRKDLHRNYLGTRMFG